MNKRLGLLAILCLLLGFAGGGLAVWLYMHSQTQAEQSSSLDRQSFELSEQSDAVKGTPEESRLMNESQKYYQEAAHLLDAAKTNRKLSIFSGIASLLLIALSVVLIFLNVKRRETDAA